MRRTITMKRDDHVSYCNKTVDYLVTGIRNHFQIRNSRVYKYVITITEGENIGSQMLVSLICICYGGGRKC